MSLRLTFSPFADGGAWPEHPGSGAAIVDQAVVGPMRLLDHLETMLGLGAPATAGVKRIAVYRRKLESAGAGRFWSASFEVDSWSTSRELLNLRDELIEAGWSAATPVSTKRLADLAAVETVGSDLPAGFADRLRVLIDMLAELPRLSLASITLIDEREALSAGMRRLLRALEACGVAIEACTPPPPGAQENDLARLLAPFDASGTRQQISGDGSVTLLTADTELVAAEALAAWLAADKADNEGLVFITGGDSALLDHALHRAGLPRLGVSAASPHRALLQVLPLAFALTWNPPNPNTLLDFLLLPMGPLPRWAANRLASRVAETPGVGGPLWRQEFDELATLYAIKAAEEPAAKRAETLANWRAFVEPERHDPVGGMPRATARGLAARVGGWAARRLVASDDALFGVLATAANDLIAAIDATEADTFDRLLIERMIEQVVGAGVGDPAAEAEAAPWRAVAHPGAIWGPAQTVVWWRFADAGEGSARSVWNRDEREALAKAGYPLDEPATALRRLAAAWERPLRHAASKVILVRPSMAAGEAPKAHPLWHAIVAGRPQLETRIGVRAEAVLRGAAPRWAGRSLTREIVALATAPDRRNVWLGPAKAIAAREWESASSLASLLACPLGWTLKYVSRLQPGVRQSIASGDQLFGTLAHLMAAQLFQPGPAPDPTHTVSRARELLEEILPQAAATLLLPGAARDLAAVRQAIPEALAELARFLHANKLEVAATEETFEAPASLGATTGVRGAIDLLAQDREGRPVVIDLKWQRSDKYRRREIADGVAIQLAVYARHSGGAGRETPAGYFMLRQKRFVTGSPLFKNAVVVEGAGLGETWDKIKTSWRGIMDELGRGELRAPFAQAEVAQGKFEDAALMTPPKCKFCDYGTLCGRP